MEQYDYNICKLGQTHFRDSPTRIKCQNKVLTKTNLKLQAPCFISQDRALHCTVFYIPASEACDCWQLHDVLVGGLQECLSNNEQRCLSVALKALRLSFRKSCYSVITWWNYLWEDMSTWIQVTDFSKGHFKRRTRRNTTMTSVFLTN